MNSKFHIQQKNTTLNQREYEGDALILNSLPRMLFIEFTRCCNLYCAMCRSKKVYSDGLFMSSDILDIIEKDWIPTAEWLDLRGSGESTLDDRLLPFIEKYAGHKNMKLFSNFNARGEKYWRKMASMPVLITLSIESAIPERYTLFRRGGNFDLMQRHLKFFKNSKAQLEFHVVVSEDNIDDLESVVRLGLEHNVVNIQFAPIIYPINFKHGFSLTPKFIDKLCKCNDLIASTNTKISLAGNLEPLNDQTHNRCSHPYSFAVFRYDGDVYCCDSFEKGSYIGNLLESNCYDIWNSKHAQALRRYHCSSRNLMDKIKFAKLDIYSHRLYARCNWCYTNKYSYYEHILDSRFRPLPLSDYIAKINSRQKQI